MENIIIKHLKKNITPQYLGDLEDQSLWNLATILFKAALFNEKKYSNDIVQGLSSTIVKSGMPDEMLSQAQTRNAHVRDALYEMANETDKALRLERASVIATEIGNILNELVEWTRLNLEKIEVEGDEAVDFAKHHGAKPDESIPVQLPKTLTEQFNSGDPNLLASGQAYLKKCRELGLI